MRLPPRPVVSRTKVEGLLTSIRPAVAVQRGLNLSGLTGLLLQVYRRLWLERPSGTKRGTPEIAHLTCAEDGS